MGKCENGNALGKWKNTNIPVTETKLNYYDKYYHEYGKEARLCFLLQLPGCNVMFHTKEIQQPACDTEMLTSKPILSLGDVQLIKNIKIHCYHPHTNIYF